MLPTLEALHLRCAPHFPETASMSLPSTSALPKNFLDQACLRETLKDKEYVHMRENLQAAMRMPAEHRWVADWLFLDSNTCFHRNILLPPEAFSSCLAVKVAQGLNPSTDDAPFALPPDFYELSPLMRLIYYPQVSDVLFIPVAAIANILVGYAIVIKIGTIPGGEAHTSFFCRFAFDTVSGDLTMILNLAAVDGAADGATMVMGMGIDHDGTKRHRVFTCPLSEYSFECIPNRVLPKDYGVENPNSQPSETDDSETLLSEYTGVQLSDEDVALGQWKTPSDNYSASQADNMQNSANGFKKPCAQSPVGQEPKIQIVETEEPRRRQKSRRPWILRENGSTADGVGIPRRPGTSSTAAGAFDMECLKRCLDVLEQALSGDLYALDVKDDVRTSSPKQVDISLQMGKADLMTASNLKDQIIQSYYSTNLSIPRDIRFNATVAPWAFAHSQRRTDNQRAVPLAPRSKEVGDWKKTEDGVQLELKVLADRKEAQRRRNRLSAARSYERRKRRKEMEEKRRLAALK